MTRPEAGGGSGLPNEWHDYGDRERGTWFEFDSDRSVQRAGPAPAQHSSSTFNDSLGGSTEVPKYEANDRVRSTKDVTGTFGGVKVPRGTEGRVVSTRDGIFTSYVTVQFSNGYTEEVTKSSLKKLGWFD